MLFQWGSFKANFNLSFNMNEMEFRSERRRFDKSILFSKLKSISYSSKVPESSTPLGLKLLGSSRQVALTPHRFDTKPQCDRVRSKGNCKVHCTDSSKHVPSSLLPYDSTIKSESLDAKAVQNLEELPDAKAVQNVEALPAVPVHHSEMQQTEIQNQSNQNIALHIKPVYHKPILVEEDVGKDWKAICKKFGKEGVPKFPTAPDTKSFLSVEDYDIPSKDVDIATRRTLVEKPTVSTSVQYSFSDHYCIDHEPKRGPKPSMLSYMEKELQYMDHTLAKLSQTAEDLFDDYDTSLEVNRKLHQLKQYHRKYTISSTASRIEAMEETITAMENPSNSAFDTLCSIAQLEVAEAHRLAHQLQL